MWILRRWGSGRSAWIDDEKPQPCPEALPCRGGNSYPEDKSFLHETVVISLLHVEVRCIFHRWVERLQHLIEGLCTSRREHAVVRIGRARLFQRCEVHVGLA